MIATQINSTVNFQVATDSGGNANRGYIYFDSIENLSLTGSSYDERFIVLGHGNYDGKGGNDGIYADWSSATSAITINNTDTTAVQSINGSTFSNIESWLVKTGSGDDVINFNSYNDAIESGAGNDIINTGGWQ